MDMPQGITQDDRVYAGLFDAAARTLLMLSTGRDAYLHWAIGSLSLNGQHLNAGNGLKTRRTKTLEFGRGEKTEVLVFDLRPADRAIT